MEASKDTKVNIYSVMDEKQKMVQISTCGAYLFGSYVIPIKIEDLAYMWYQLNSPLCKEFDEITNEALAGILGIFPTRTSATIT